MSRGAVCLGLVGHGKAGSGTAWCGAVGSGMVRQPKARFFVRGLRNKQGQVRSGMAGQGLLWYGLAR